MAWSPGNRSGGGIWRSLASFNTQKSNRAAAQAPRSTVSGSFDRVESSDTVVATAVLSVIDDPRVAALSITEAGDTISAAANLKIAAALAVTEAADVLSATVGPLITPTITNVSTTGTAPLVLSLSDGEYVAGRYLEWEFASGLTPTANADGSYATPTQRGVAFIDGESWSRLDLALGYNDPSGAFSFHCRVLRENEFSPTTISYTDPLGNAISFNADTSAWTDDYTDTIADSVAKLSTVTGTNKSRYVTVSDTQVYSNANVGLIGGARATIAAQNTKWHAEFRIDHFYSGGGGSVKCGITNGTFNFDAGSGVIPSGTEPGLSSNPGITIGIGLGSTQLSVHSNGGNTNYTVPAVALGDAIILEGDTSANTIKVYYWDASASALANGGAALGTITLTGAYIPAAWYAWAGGVKGSAGNVSSSDAMTFFPDTEFMAFSSGYALYG